MARKTHPAELDGTQIVGKTPQALAVAEAQMQQDQQQVLIQYGDGGPYVRETYVAEIRRDMARTVEAILNVGRRLLVMKAHEGHGEWLQCLGSLGIGEDNAQRMMLAARRIDALPNAATSRHLLEAAGSGSKLFDLMTLPEDELGELVQGGALSTGASLGDIAHMTVRELREALREHRDTIAAKDERAAAREQEIDQLSAKVRKLEKRYRAAAPADRVAELRVHASAIATAVRAQIIVAEDGTDSVRTRIAELIAAGVESGDPQQAYCAGLLADIEASLQALRAEFGLAAPAAQQQPEWLQQAKADGVLS